MQQLQQKLFALFIIGGLLVLSSCGWHLRGVEPLPEEFKTLYLSVPNETSELSRSLKQSLRAMGVNLTDKATDAAMTLAITDVKNNRRTVSTSGRGKAAEYELTSLLTYEIRNNEGATLYGPDTVSAEKIYLFDPNSVVSAFEEEQILRKEMQRDLIQQLMRRYQAAKVTAPESS